MWSASGGFPGLTRRYGLRTEERQAAAAQEKATAPGAVAEGE
jgi:hypothetical protein